MKIKMSRFPHLLALVLVSLNPATGKADDLSVSASYFDFTATPTHKTFSVGNDTTSSSVQKHSLTTHGSSSGSASYGGISLSLNTSVGTDYTNMDFKASGAYNDTIWITPGNAALLGTPGVARFTFSVGGSMTGSNLNDGGDISIWSASINGISFGGSLTTAGVGTGFGLGVFPGSVGTVTQDIGFTFGGGPIGISAGGGAHVSLGSLSSSTAISLTVSGGSYQVLSAGVPVNYTATSSTGSSAGSNVASGNSFTGFSVTDTGIGSHATTLSILGGTASADRNVNVSFVAPPSGSTGTIIGDVSNVTGFGSTPGAATDLFVVQENYDPAAAIAQFGSTDNLLLKWYDTVGGAWKLATDGDFGGTPTFINGAYDPLNDLQLGYYGLDTVNHNVWAVVNHNSEFGVGNATPAPEPSQGILLLLGGSVFAMRRMRKV